MKRCWVTLNEADKNGTRDLAVFDDTCGNLIQIAQNREILLGRSNGVAKNNLQRTFFMEQRKPCRSGVIRTREAAAVALSLPVGAGCCQTTEPASAATLAARLGIARQKVNYHLHFEDHQLDAGGRKRWG